MIKVGSIFLSIGFSYFYFVAHFGDLSSWWVGIVYLIGMAATGATGAWFIAKVTEHFD